LHIIIVEDEPPIAEEIEDCCRSILGNQITHLKVFYTLEEATSYLDKNSIDLCLLDLNLHGRNGYEVLKYAVSGAFQTIVISAYTDQAIEAFEYGVIDFVPKPFSENRLKKAFDRFLGNSSDRNQNIKYIVARRQGKYYLIYLRDVSYFKAEGYVVEVFLKSGQTELIDKSLAQLEQILPENFIRIHRSYIVDLQDVISYHHDKGGVYNITLKDETVLPLGRKYNRVLRGLLIK
jgi:DNA-binding LytR/AlgR family response regulator